MSCGSRARLRDFNSWISTDGSWQLEVTQEQSLFAETWEICQTIVLEWGHWYAPILSPLWWATTSVGGNKLQTLQKITKKYSQVTLQKARIVECSPYSNVDLCNTPWLKVYWAYCKMCCSFIVNLSCYDVIFNFNYPINLKETIQSCSWIWQIKLWCLLCSIIETKNRKKDKEELKNGQVLSLISALKWMTSVRTNGRISLISTVLCKCLLSHLPFFTILKNGCSN